VTATLGVIAISSWIASASVYALPKRRAWVAEALAMLGVLAGVLLLGLLWVSLGRPPMRTLGETRWWYAVTVPAVSLLIGWRFQTAVMAIPSLLMGAMFALINLRNPETMDRTLMPALQSPWFVPHVVVYMVAYSALGLSSAVAVWQWGRCRWRRQPLTPADVALPHRLVLVGFPLLTAGLLFGALWAKEAWGHYWTWDPKETWAFLSWISYLIYLHVRQRHPMKPHLNLALLVVGFAVLMGCWFGVNYLPTARESVHTYTQPAEGPQ